jgi:RNA polymerase sigma factor (sigma-70 family)
MKEALEVLGKLRRLLRSRGRTRDQADDLIQEAFVRLQTYCQDRAVDKPEAFLVRTTLNLLVDESRRAAVESGPARALEGITLADPYPVPEELLIEREEVDWLTRGLEELSPRVREVFLLNRIEGYSYPQIARQLGLSPRTVEKHVAKASLFLITWMAKDTHR